MNDKFNEPVAEIVSTNTFGYDVYEAELLESGVNLPKGTKLYARPDVDALKAENAEIREELMKIKTALEMQGIENDRLTASALEQTK